MNWFRSLAVRLQRVFPDEGGQTMAVVALAATMIVSTTALAIDAGHARYTYRELQQVTDSAALAAARSLSTASVSTNITGLGATQRVFSSIASNGVSAQYSAVTGGWNARTTLPNVSVTTTLLCLNTLKAQGIPCIGLVPYNAVRVTQVSVMPTYFAGVLGKPNLTLSTTSTAAIRGGSPRPSNIAVIMDTTLSMNDADNNCGYTQMQCALNGLQVLLKNLSPCGDNQTTCNAANGVAVNSFDRVSLFTFPNVSTSTASLDTACTTPFSNNYYYDSVNNFYYSMPPQTAWQYVPTDTAYTFPSTSSTGYSPNGSTYQLTPYYSDYRVSDVATSLNTSSLLVQASGGRSGCGSMLPANFDGVYGTYYAGAIYAAQASLLSAQAANPGSDNVIILLSDGDATAPQYNGTTSVMPGAGSSGSYPSYLGECGQGITAAAAATSAGTMVYTVAYGSSALTGCASDALVGSNIGVSPCDAMAKMASSAQMFYSDWKQTGSDGTCISSQPVTSLNSIFSAIANDLTQARLIPNNTT